MKSTGTRIDARFDAVGRSRTFQNIVNTHNLQTKSVLDIGCSFGEHLSHFGPGSTGLTIEPTEATEGQRRGLDVRIANVEDDLALERTYDAIYCSNLLEHLYAPHAFLHDIRAVLKPNGILVLGVPVLPFPTVLMRLRKFRGALAIQHINFFVAPTLAYTVERAGWNIHAVRGFRIKSRVLDRLVRMLYPHLYVIATPDQSFQYSEKRQRELAGYTKL